MSLSKLTNKEKEERAKQLYLQSKGKARPVDIAKELNVPVGTVKSWKSRGKWVADIKSTLEVVTPAVKQPTKKRGAQKGNSNAVKTGEYATVVLESTAEKDGNETPQPVLDKRQSQLLLLQTLTIREDRLLKHLNTLDITNSKWLAFDEALTRVQTRKQRAIEVLHKMDVDRLRMTLDMDKLKWYRQRVMGRIDLDEVICQESLLAELEELSLKVDNV